MNYTTLTYEILYLPLLLIPFLEFILNDDVPEMAAVSVALLLKEWR